jgi:hypothetical protein
VLALFLAACILALIVRHAWRAYRLVLHERDGSLPPLVVEVISGLSASVLLPIFIARTVSGVLILSVERACLCAQVSGLVTADLYGLMLLLWAGVLAVLCTQMVEAVARVRFEFRHRGYARPDAEPPPRRQEHAP